MNATITYRPNAQKTQRLFDLILTPQILADICFRVTGQVNYRLVKDISTYNRGRLVIVEYDGIRTYVTLSEASIDGRNSSLQSVPTAINMFFADNYRNKHLCYYFIPHIGNAFTDYHKFIYRLMITSGINFINISDYCHESLFPYHNVDELINDRTENQSSNSSNNSSYVSRSTEAIQIYAKTFGASKYESTLLAVAVSKIADRPIELYNICEQDLKRLPQASVNTIEMLGNISMHYTSLFLDKRDYLEQTDRTVLRSASYLYNLFNRLGNKKCALCGCEIPEIIQGAHIWGVAQIAKTTLDDEVKFNHAVSGHNGLWLCQNHHKLFDSNIIIIDGEGNVQVKDDLSSNNIDFIHQTTIYPTIQQEFLSNDFISYIEKRNTDIDYGHFHRIAI